ncbi:MAG: cupin domain-containing protein [Ignavibacteria bacterium]
MENKKEKLIDMIQFQNNSIVSRQIIKKQCGNVTLFAFDKDESLTEHSSPYEALVQIIAGKMVVTIGGQPQEVGEGEVILLPPNIPHGLYAKEKTKMILTMIK